MKTLFFLRVAAAVMLLVSWGQAQQPQGWVTLGGANQPAITVYQDASEVPASLAAPANSAPAQTGTAGNVADVATPEITELARGLEHDPEKIFEWVKGNIAFTHYYGVVKGAALTLEERSGNDADTCALMVSLLRQCPEVVSASYVQGVTSLPLSGAVGSCNLADWLGVDADVTLIGNRIFNGGTPAEDFYGISSGGVVNYHWRRWWVRVVTAQGSVDYDPSFKVHVRTASAVFPYAYSKTNLRTAVGTANGDVLEQAANTAFETEIKNRVSGLVSYLRTNFANADAEVLTGSVKVGRLNSTLSGQVRFPLSSTGGSVYDSLPTALMTTVRIIAGGLDVSLKTAELRGETLWMQMGGQCVLYLGDQLLAVEPAGASQPTVTFEVSVDHPGTAADQGMTPKALPRAGVRTIGYGFTCGSESLLRHQLELSRLKAFSYASDTPRIRAEAQNVLAQYWMMQTEGAVKMLGGLTHVTHGNRHRFGFVADEYDPAVNQGGYYIDYPLQVLSLDARKAGVNVGAVSATLGFIASAMEHAVIAQTQGDQAASAARMLSGNEGGLRPKLLLATPANWSALKNQAVNYAAGDIAVMDGIVANNGMVLLPANGSQAIQQWVGAGYMTYEDNAAYYRAQGLITGGFKGGYSGLVKNISANAVNIMAQTRPRSYNSAPPVQRPVTAGDPVNMNSGQFVHEATDLVIGGGVLPRGITFGRRYDGAHRHHNVAGLGQGWSHNLDITLAITSDADAALGGGSALQAATMAMSLYIAHDLFKNRTDVKDWALSVMIANWAANQTVNKAASVRLPDRVLQFLQLPDGSWAPPTGCTAALTRQSMFDFNQGFQGYEYDLQERHGSRWHFGMNGRLAYVEDVFGQRATFNGKTSVTDHQGRTLTLNYNTEGQLTSVTDFTGRTVNFAYQGSPSAPTLISVTGDTSAAGHYSYDLLLRMTHVRDVENTLVVQNTLFDSQDRVIEQVSQNDPARKWRYYYQPHQTIEENPLGQRTRHLFDDQKRSTGTVNALGHQITTVYGKANMPVSHQSPLGYTTSTVYNADLNPISSKDALNNTTTYTYDTQKRLLKASPPSTAVYSDETVINAYNSWHQPLSVTQGGVTTTYTYIQSGLAIGQLETTRVNGTRKSWNVYNAQGLLSEVWIGADGQGQLQSTLTYTPLGDILTQTAFGATTTHEYNTQRQVTKTTLSAAGGGPAYITTFTYTPQGDLKTTTNPRGHTTTTHYNVLRKPTSVVQPDGSSSSIGYDLADRAITATSALQQTVTTTLDAAGQPTAVKDPLNRTQTTVYDAEGRTTASIDPMNRVSSTVYTPRGEIESTVQPDNAVASNTYDVNGRRTSLTNRRGKKWTFEYDSLGRPIKVIDPVGWTSLTTYDGEGRVNSLREPSLEKAVLVYEAAYGRLQKTQYFSASNSTTPVAEVAHTYHTTGLLHTTTEGTATITRDYTADARRLIQTYTNAAGDTFGYLYDANGNLTQLTLPDGKLIHYAYDNRDRLTSVTDWAGRVTTIIWDAASRLTKFTRPNGTVRSVFYDAASQITRIEERNSSGRLIQMVKLGLDAVGRAEKRFTVPLPAAVSFPPLSFTYDDSNRLQGRLYDFDGNLRQVPKVPAPTGQAALGPQPGINTVTGSTTNATWDTRNRLTSLNLQGGGAVTFTYDAENLRLSKTRGSQTTIYTHHPHGLSGMSECTVETLPDGSKRWYVWGGSLGLLYDVSSSGAVRYYHGDQVGSTLALTDAAGAVIGRADYTPYGLMTRRTGNMDTPFLYNGTFGVMTDSETGLVHMRARYYHPWLARFLNVDPSGFGGGLNMYVFADGNPVMLLDALGLDARNAASAYTTRSSSYSQGLNHRPMTFAQADWSQLTTQTQTRRPSTSSYEFASESNVAAIQQNMARMSAEQNRTFNHVVNIAMAAVAIIEPTPLGEAALATRMGTAARGAKTAIPKITERGIQRIESHLSRPGLENALGGPALKDPANAHMIGRLRGGHTTTQDINFYMHELKESAIMNRGVGAREAHLQTLQWQGIPYIRGYESQLYAPDAVRLFNTLP